MVLTTRYHNGHYQNHMAMGMRPNSMYRSFSMESIGGYGYMEQNQVMMEKRQLFLRSYQFSRKRSLTERIKRSLMRVKRVVWLRLRSARRLRRVVWSRLRLRFAFFQSRRRRFVRLLNSNHGSRHSYCF